MTIVEIDLKKDGVFDLTPDVRVIILAVGHGYCKLGFEAPNHIRILRGELLEKSCGQPEQEETVKYGGDVMNATE